MQPNGSDPLWRLEKALAEGAARDPVQPDRATESGPPTETGRPEFSTLLGDLSGAIAVVTVAHGSLEAKEIGEVGDEEVAQVPAGFRPNPKCAAGWRQQKSQLPGAPVRVHGDVSARSGLHLWRRL